MGGDTTGSWGRWLGSWRQRARSRTWSWQSSAEKRGGQGSPALWRLQQRFIGTSIHPKTLGVTWVKEELVEDQASFWLWLRTKQRIWGRQGSQYQLQGAVERWLYCCSTICRCPGVNGGKHQRCQLVTPGWTAPAEVWRAARPSR